MGQVLRTIIWPARFGKSQNSEILKRRFYCDHSPTGRVIHSNSSVDELPGGRSRETTFASKRLNFDGWLARVVSAQEEVGQTPEKQLKKR